MTTWLLRHPMILSLATALQTDRFDQVTVQLQDPDALQRHEGGFSEALDPVVGQLELHEAAAEAGKHGRLASLEQVSR